MSWATKYRPTTFDEIVGQKIAKTTIMNELEAGKLRQAYIFAGNSGTAKTTMSRIIADKVNGITMEIDTASHNTTEAMGNIVDTMKIKPINADRLVVILDEFHVASPKAIQKLLIFLEHIPQHVMIIMCTTELDKIPNTIKNRCEVIEFTKISVEDMLDRLELICDDMGVAYEPPAIKAIAKLADGSMRQAIAYMEQLSTNKEGITLDEVESILIGGNYTDGLNLLYAVCDKDISLIKKTISGLKNPGKFLDAFLEFTMDVVIYDNSKSFTLTNIPEGMQKNIMELTKGDIDKDKKIIGKVVDLELRAKNSPILNQLFLATLIGIAEGL